MLASTAWRRGRILRGAAALLAAQRELLLDCGAGVRLQCFVSSPAPGGGPVVLLHGWEGSADSLYVLSLAQQLFAQRFAVVRLNLRDHGDTHHLNRELFHSCRLPEGIGAVRALQQHFAGTALRLVGFSLGGNLDRKSTRLNSSHSQISYAVFCLKKKKIRSTEESHSDPARCCQL